MNTFDNEIKGIILYLSVMANSTHHQQEKRTFDLREVKDLLTRVVENKRISKGL
jgi:hypothetical protein